jgi:hypothetical protein
VPASSGGPSITTSPRCSAPRSSRTSWASRAGERPGHRAQGLPGARVMNSPPVPWAGATG